MFYTMQQMQQAVYQLLSQDTVLMQQIEAVYDGTPEVPQFPCVLLGRTDAKDWSTKTAKGCQIVMHVHVLTDAPGRKDSQDIMERVQQLLETGYIQLNSLNIVAKRVEDAESQIMDEHEIAGAATLRLRAFTEAA